MNNKSLTVFGLSVVTALFAHVTSHSSAQAGDAPLEAHTTFSSTQEEGFRMSACGQVENTPVTCIEPFRDCNRAYEKLIRNARNVCEQLSGCRVDYDSNLVIFPPGSSYQALIAIPVNLFKKGDEVNIINTCRSNPPPVNPEEQAEQDRLREETLRAEQGLPALNPNDPKVQRIRLEYGLIDSVVAPVVVPAPAQAITVPAPAQPLAAQAPAQDVAAIPAPAQNPAAIPNSAQDQAAVPVNNDNNNAANNTAPAGNAETGGATGSCSLRRAAHAYR